MKRIKIVWYEVCMQRSYLKDSICMLPFLLKLCSVSILKWIIYAKSISEEYNKGDLSFCIDAALSLLSKHLCARGLILLCLSCFVKEISLSGICVMSNYFWSNSMFSIQIGKSMQTTAPMRSYILQENKTIRSGYFPFTSPFIHMFDVSTYFNMNTHDFILFRLLVAYGY